VGAAGRLLAALRSVVEPGARLLDHAEGKSLEPIS
jgi:hypothetical protein